MRRRSQVKAILFGSLLVLVVPCVHAALPGDSAEGERLVVANCMSCHDTGVFTRADHKIQSLDALKRQLAACGHGAKVDFSTTQTDSIVKYLDERFYHFP